jgi:hypothetical protein
MESNRPVDFLWLITRPKIGNIPICVRHRRLQCFNERRKLGNESGAPVLESADGRPPSSATSASALSSFASRAANGFCVLIRATAKCRQMPQLPRRRERAALAWRSPAEKAFPALNFCDQFRQFALRPIR